MINLNPPPSAQSISVPEVAVAVGAGITFKVFCLAVATVLMLETDPCPLAGLAVDFVE